MIAVSYVIQVATALVAVAAAIVALVALRMGDGFVLFVDVVLFAVNAALFIYQFRVRAQLRGAR